MDPRFTKEEQLSFKKKLKQFCEEAIAERISFTRASMENAQAAANGEEKSSAGDKYETSRAMNHLEKDMHARQLAAHLQELHALQAVQVNTICIRVGTGAFIKCDKMSFFIAAGLGKQMVDSHTITFLSPQAPLAKQLSDKLQGDRFNFNGEMVITDIF